MGYNAKYSKELANKVTEFRMKRGLTNKQLATMTDLSVTTITSVQRYGHVGSQYTIKKLAEALDIDKYELVPKEEFVMLPQYPKTSGDKSRPKRKRERNILMIMRAVAEFDDAEINKILAYIHHVRSMKPPR